MSLSARAVAFMASISIFAVAACANLGDASTNQDLYDLGTVQLAVPPVVMPAAIEVRSSSWLGRSAMQYRFDYQQPAQRRAYAQSRWVSPPAEMIQKVLARAFAREGAIQANSAAEACRVRIELDEFVQSFTAPGDSESVILARAELLPARGEQRIASHLITIRERAATPDAAGGVTAHQVAAARLAGELADWLHELVKDSTSITSHCR